MKESKYKGYISFQHFTARLPESVVLNDVTLQIKPGITAVIGTSGSGKSTLLRAVNRMIELHPDMSWEGKVLLGNTEVTAIDPMELRRRVGIVFDQPNPFPMSVYDNVAYGPRVHGMKNGKMLAQLVENALTVVGLRDKDVHKRMPAEQLPMVKQQLLCIARVLALGPEVLLLDEPTACLDAADTACIEELILKLKNDVTIVLVTRDTQQAGRLSDQTVFLMDGELIETGLTREFFFRPRDKRTEDYLTGRFAG